jgi:hypothetical protein
MLLRLHLVMIVKAVCMEMNIPSPSYFAIAMILHPVHNGIDRNYRRLCSMSFPTVVVATPLVVIVTPAKVVVALA